MRLLYHNSRIFATVKGGHLGLLPTLNSKNTGDKHFIEKESESFSYTLINVESLNGLRFEFSEKSPSVAWICFFYDENDIRVGGRNLSVGLTDVYVSVPESAVYVGVLYNPKTYTEFTVLLN